VIESLKKTQTWFLTLKSTYILLNTMYPYNVKFSRQYFTWLRRNSNCINSHCKPMGRSAFHRVSQQSANMCLHYAWNACGIIPTENKKELYSMQIHCYYACFYVENICKYVNSRNMPIVYGNAHIRDLITCVQHLMRRLCGCCVMFVWHCLVNKCGYCNN